MQKGLAVRRSVQPPGPHSRLPVWAVLALSIILVSSQNAGAQVLFGSVVGNVVDASGSVVPGAAVKITETSTNDVFNTQTNDSGIYSVSTLPAGVYSVEITKPGFRTFVTTNIVVNQNNVVRVDASLQVGAQVEKVEVTAEAAALQTDRADIHSEVSTQQLENLPQPNRTWENLIELTPGSTPPNGQLQGGTNNPSKSMSFSFNGETPAPPQFELRASAHAIHG